MNADFFTTSRLAGLLMLTSIAIIIGAVALLAAQGRLNGLSAAFNGVYARGKDVSGLRTIVRFSAAFTMALLLAWDVVAWGGTPAAFRWRNTQTGFAAAAVAAPAQDAVGR